MKLAKAITDYDGFLYKSKFICAGGIIVQTGKSPRVNFMLLDDVNTLVKKCTEIPLMMVNFITMT